MGRGPGARVGVAQAGARGRGELRPRQFGADPARREAAQVARGQGPTRVHIRAAEVALAQPELRFLTNLATRRSCSYPAARHNAIASSSAPPTRAVTRRAPHS